MSLKVWLPLNGNLENLGTSSNNFTINTNPVYVNNGKIGQAVSTGQITMPAGTTASILNNTAFSFTCWIYINAAAGDTTNRAMIFGNGGMTAPNNRKFSIFQYPSCNDLHLSWQNDTNSTFIAGVWSGVFPSYKWTHLAVTYQNPSGTIYINGIQYATFTGVSNSASFEFDTVLFSNCPNQGRYLNDYRIYDHCLSAAEVKEIAQGLVLHYKLDGFQGNFGNPNLVTGSNTASTSTNTWNLSMQTGDKTNTIEYENGVPLLVVTRGTTEQSGWCFLSYSSLRRTEIKVSTTYTVSFDIKSVQAGTISFTGFLNSNATNYMTSSAQTIQGTVTANVWSHIVLQCTTKDDFSGITVGSQIVYMSPSTSLRATGNVMKFKNIKVEEGETETPWCPADSELTIDRTHIQDSSGYGHNGTLNDTTAKISTSTQRYSAALLTSQANNSATYPIKGECNIPESTALTFAWWMNPATFGAQTSGIFSTSNNDTPTDYNTTAANMRDSCFDCCNTSGTCVRINIASHLTLNEWHHYALTYNGSQLNFYKDGVSKVTANQTGALKAFQYIYPFYSKAGGVNRCTSGSLSDFRICVTALSAADVKQLYEVGGKIDNKANLHTYELNEFGSNKLTKTGILKDYIVEPFLTLSDGSKWQLMLYHYVDGGRNLFTSSNATYCNDFGLYSRLRDIDNFKYDSTKYEFYVLQDDVEYRWTQTNAPMTTTSVAGYTAITGSPSGICKCAGNTVLARSNSTGNWWNACGSWTLHGGGIPGFGQTVCFRYLALYARVTDFNAKIANLSASASNFIEL